MKTVLVLNGPNLNLLGTLAGVVLNAGASTAHQRGPVLLTGLNAPAGR